MRPKEFDRSTDVAGDTRCRSVRSSRLRRTDLDENPFVLSTRPTVFLHMLAALAAWERDRLAERTSEGMAYARESYRSNGDGAVVCNWRDSRVCSVCRRLPRVKDQ